MHSVHNWPMRDTEVSARDFMRNLFWENLKDSVHYHDCALRNSSIFTHCPCSHINVLMCSSVCMCWCGYGCMFAFLFTLRLSYAVLKQLPVPPTLLRGKMKSVCLSVCLLCFLCWKLNENFSAGAQLIVQPRCFPPNKLSNWIFKSRSMRRRINEFDLEFHISDGVLR